MNKKDLFKPWSSFDAPYDMKSNDQYDIQQQPDINSSLKAIKKEDANLEAEVGELALKPDLSGIYRIGGKTHAKGGTPLKLDDGSFIFSNDKKLHINKNEKKAFEFKEGGTIGKTRNTPALVLKREIDLKHYNKTAHILNDKLYDTIAKNSSALMQQKYQEKIGQVAFIQEAKKGFPTGVPNFSQNTAPIYDPQIKDEIDSNPQYMKRGGYLATGGDIINPFDPDPYKGGKKRTPTGLNNAYDRPPSYLNNWEKYIPGVSKMDNTRAQTAIYDYMLDNNPDAVNSMWQKYGLTSEGLKYPGLKSMTTQGKFNSSNIPQDDLEKLEAGYADGLFGARQLEAPDSNIDLNKLRPGLSTVPNPNGNPSTPYPGIQTSNPGNPLAPNPFEQSTTLPYKPKIPFSPLQKANLLYSAYNALTVPRFAPQRPQIQSPLVELEKYNPQAALNSVDNSAYDAYEANSISNPYLAANNNAAIFGKALEARNSVIGDYQNRNVGVANQQNIANNQIQRQDNQFNVQANNNYYNQLQNLNQSYADEKRFARNQTVSLFNQYAGENQQLEQFLASQRTAGKVQIGVDKQGNPIYQNKPLYDVNTRGLSPTVYYTGAGTLDGIPQQSSKASDIPYLVQQLKASGITTDSAISRIIASSLQKGNLQQPYQYRKGGKTKNPFI